MYYPKQIPYLLDKEFQENMKYEEFFIEELKNYCMCIWKMKSKKILNKTIYNFILPDACIDIVINFTEKDISFAGFSKETIPFELNQKIDYMGVRLKPGSFYLLFGIEADKIMDHPIPFKKVEKSVNIDEILEVEEEEKRLEILKKYLIEKIKNNPDKEIMDIVEQLYQNPKEKTVSLLAQDFHWSERHLYRVFKTYYGVSPKVLLNILRLHLCLTLLLEENMDLLDIANLCGFYDQSHFIREMKRYTGISPLKLLDNYH